MAGIKIPISIDNANFTAAAAEAQKAVRSVSSDVRGLEGDTKDAAAGIKDMLTQAAAFGGISLGFAGAKEFVTQIVDVRKEMQSYSTALSVLLGDQGKANAMFEELKQFAVTTPLMFKDLASGAQTMLGFNIEAERVVPTLKAIGDISMGDAQKFQSLTLAFSQMSATGKLMGQDLLQMINAGFNPLTEMSRQTGKSISALKDEMSNGAISADMVASAFMSATQEGGKFNGMLEKQGKGIAGQMNTLQGAIDDMFNTLGERSEGIIVGSIQGLTTLVQNWESVGTAITTAAAAYGTYKALEMGTTAVGNVLANASYTAELEALRTLIPAKEEAVNLDLQQAVSTGAITKAKAQEIAALRTEANAQLEALAAEETKARNAYKHATEQHLLAQRNMAVAQSQVKIAIASGDAEEIAAAKKGAAAAKTELHNAAIAKNTAHQQLNAASTGRAAAATALDASASKGAAASTNLLTAAKAKLNAITKAVNASFLASPLFWIAVAIAGVSFAVYKLITAESEEEKARKQSNKSWEEFAGKQNEYKNKIEELTSACRDMNKPLIEQYKAWNQLREQFPDIIKKYGTLRKLQMAGKDEIDAIVNEALENEKRSKATQDVADAQARLNEARKTYNEAVKSGFVSGDALAVLKNMVVSAEAAYKEAARVRDQYFLEEARAIEQANEERTPIEIRVQEAEGNKERIQQAIDYLNEATAALQEEEIDVPNIAPKKRELDEIIADVEEKLAEAQKNLKENPLSVEAQADVDTLKGVKASLVTLKKEMETSGTTQIPFWFVEDVDKTNEELQKAKDKLDSIVSQQNADGKGAEVHNKAYWEAQKKEAQAALDLLDTETADAKEVAALKKKIAEAESHIKSYSVSNAKTVSDKAKQASEDARKLEELRAKQAQDEKRLEKDRALETEQARIDGMKEGAEKVREQIQQDYDKEKEQIERQREDMKQQREDNARALWEAENPTKVKNDAQAWEKSGAKKQYQDTYQEAYGRQDNDYFDMLDRRNEQKRQKRLAQQQQEEESAMLDYLTAYGSYEQQKEAIRKKYEERQTKAKNEGESRMLTEQMNSELSAIESKFGKSKSKLQKLWKDVSSSSRKDIASMIGQLNTLQKAIEDGTISSDERNILQSLGFTAEDIQEVETGNKTVDDIIARIAQLKGTLGNTGTAFDKVGEAWTKVFGENGEVNAENLQSLLGALNGAGSACETLLGGVGDIAAAFGDNDLKKNIEDVSTVLGNTISMAGAGASIGGGWGALAGAVVGLGSGLAQVFSSHTDDTQTDRITALSKSIKRLQQSYDSLSKSIDETYSTDKAKNIEAEIANLNRQNQLIRQQIYAEQSKKGASDEAIESYRDQIYENEKTMQELREQAKDAIFGEDIQAAIQNFADAYSDAWADNTNRTKTAKEQVRQMMQSMVKESIKAATESSGAMQKIREKLTEFYKDGVFTAEEQAAIYREAEALQKDLDARYSWADDLLDSNKDFTQQGTSGGFTSMSQESADELNGRFAASQVTMDGILQQALLLSASNQQLVDVTTEGNKILDEIRNLMIGMSGNVEDIAAYIKAISSHVHVFNEMNRKLDRL